MSKAEKAAEESGYSKDPLCRAEYTAYEVKEAFIDGYHQAEKDLELTWEDVKAIFLLVQVEWSPNKNEEEIYQEVLKRFKKERKEK